MYIWLLEMKGNNSLSAVMKAFLNPISARAYASKHAEEYFYKKGLVWEIHSSNIETADIKTGKYYRLTMMLAEE